MKDAELTFYATFTPDTESGGYVVQFDDLPEAITQGDTLEEAIENAKDCLKEALVNRIIMSQISFWKRGGTRLMDSERKKRRYLFRLNNKPEAPIIALR